MPAVWMAWCASVTTARLLGTDDASCPTSTPFVPLTHGKTGTVVAYESCFVLDNDGLFGSGGGDGVQSHKWASSKGTCGRVTEVWDLDMACPGADRRDAAAAVI